MAFIGDGRRSGDWIGRDQDSYVAGESAFVASDKSSLSTLAVEQELGYLRADQAERLLIDISAVKDALVPHSYGEDTLFWRIWFEPAEYDAGFITEDSQFDIKIWNAYLDTLSTITDISVLAQEGTSIDNDPVPIKIQKFGDNTSEVTISRIGPPLQSTVYTFTVDSVEYTCTITGMRIIDWVLEPDWARKVRIEFAFETVVAENRFFKEQRRYLREDCSRTIKVSSWAEGLDAQKVKQSLSYGHDKVFGVPIYSEHCYPTGTITGQTVLNFTNDLTKLWNLNNLCDYIIIADHKAMTGEIKEVSSVGGSSITLVRSVVQTFEAASVIVYPVIMTTLESLSLQDETQDVTVFDLSFEEYRSGG